MKIVLDLGESRTVQSRRNSKSTSKVHRPKKTATVPDNKEVSTDIDETSKFNETFKPSGVNNVESNHDSDIGEFVSPGGFGFVAPTFDDFDSEEDSQKVEEQSSSDFEATSEDNSDVNYNYSESDAQSDFEMPVSDVSPAESELFGLTPNFKYDNELQSKATPYDYTTSNDDFRDGSMDLTAFSNPIGFDQDPSSDFTVPNDGMDLSTFASPENTAESNLPSSEDGEDNFEISAPIFGIPSGNVEDNSFNSELNSDSEFSSSSKVIDDSPQPIKPAKSKGKKSRKSTGKRLDIVVGEQAASTGKKGNKSKKKSKEVPELKKKRSKKEKNRKIEEVVESVDEEVTSAEVTTEPIIEEEHPAGSKFRLGFSTKNKTKEKKPNRSIFGKKQKVQEDEEVPDEGDVNSNSKGVVEGLDEPVSVEPKESSKKSLVLYDSRDEEPEESDEEFNSFTDYSSSKRTEKINNVESESSDDLIEEDENEDLEDEYLEPKQGGNILGAFIGGLTTVAAAGAFMFIGTQVGNLLISNLITKIIGG